MSNSQSIVKLPPSALSRRTFLGQSAATVAAAGLVAGCEGAGMVPDRGGRPPADVAALTVWDFARVVGEPFQIQLPGEAGFRQARLLDVENRGERYQVSWRDPFSAYFHVDGAGPLPQGMYVVDHPSTGRHTLFLVPVGMGAPRLEALFT